MNLKRRLLKKQRLYLIVNVTPSQRPSFVKLKDAIRRGADIVQLRCKEISDGLFLDYALRLAKLCRPYGVIFIVNDRADIALAADADGLHIGQDDIPPSLARNILGINKIIGISTHSRQQIEKALKTKEIDYIGVGPVFKTPSKPGKRPLGLGIIKYASEKMGSFPFFAIGGINLKNIGSLLKTGARQIAVSDCVFNTENPAKNAMRLRKIVYGAD